MRSEILNRVADIIEANPSILTYGTLAADKDGNYTNPTHPEATCFCAIGLIARELNIDAVPGYHTQTGPGVLGLTRIQIQDLYRTNDRALAQGQGCAPVVNLLRALAHAD